MPITRSFESAYALTDWTPELLLIPNQWGLVNQLGIFSSEPVSNYTVTVESVDMNLQLMVDQARYGKRNMNKNDLRKLRSFPLPHFNLDDVVTPEDVQGKRAYNTPDMPETKDMVMMRKLESIRRKHAALLEYGRCYALTQGAIYAPNGTAVSNYYTDFGITRKEVDFILGTAGTEVGEKVEEAVAHIQDNLLTGDMPSGYVALCSPTWFAKFIKHAKIVNAFQYYTGTQEPLRDRLGGIGRHRRFNYTGVDFIEYRGSFKDANGAAQALIPSGDAYLVPTGVADAFISYFGPATKDGYENTLGEEAYVFTFPRNKMNGTDIETETNQLHLLRRPQAVVRLYTSN